MVIEWFKKAVIYQIFIDRFNGFEDLTNKPDFLGGNIKGVTEKLEYLQSLGVNVVWLSPFYKTSAYHGYHITDFKKVDSRFGTISELQVLLNKAHEMGMHVIVDFVPNHCSVFHPFFEDAIKNKNSIYRDWFIFEKWPDDYRCFLDFKELPKLNFDNLEVANYFIEIANYWLAMGIDGFRIDHAIGISHRYWKRFRNEIKQNYPNSVLIGEVWGKGIKPKQFKTIEIKYKWFRKFVGINQEKLQIEYCNELDGVLDFALNDMLVQNLNHSTGFKDNMDLNREIRKHLEKIPDGYTMVGFLDNHDMDRFLMHCRGHINCLLDAFELLLSLDIPVVIYYGTETGMRNEVSINNPMPNADLAVREPMDWGNINPEIYMGIQTLIKNYR